MSFTKFDFTRKWTNSTDFPTVETDERTVRADMQALHDQNRDGVHALIDELEASTAAASLGALNQNGAADTVQQVLDDLQDKVEDFLESSSSAPVDRNVALSNEVSEALELGALSTVKDALMQLSVYGKYTKYWWRRRPVSTLCVSEPVQDEKRPPDLNHVFLYFYQSSGGSREKKTVEYSEGVQMSLDGRPVLAEPVQTLIVSYNTLYEEQVRDTLAGKYVHNPETGGVIYVSEQAVIQKMSGNDSYYYGWPSIVSVVTVQTNPWENVYSADREAFPDSGVKDGYEYQYVGIPEQSMNHGAQICSFSYTGSGAFGARHPNRVSMPFPPKLVLVSSTSDSRQTILWIAGMTMDSTRKYEIDETTLSWSTDKDMIEQLNMAGQHYVGVALG